MIMGSESSGTGWEQFFSQNWTIVFSIALLSTQKVMSIRKKKEKHGDRGIDVKAEKRLGAETQR